MEHCVPSLDEMAGDWISTYQMAMEPSLRNFCSQALVNRDMASISWLAGAPFAGGYHTGALRIQGQTPLATTFRWFPYQALRKASYDDLELSSITRMPVEEHGVFWTISIRNHSQTARELAVEQDLIGVISEYSDRKWEWRYPFPHLNGEEIENRNRNDLLVVRQYIGRDNPQGNWTTRDQILDYSPYTARVAKDGLIVVEDGNSPAKTVFHLLRKPDSIQTRNSGATVRYTVNLQPGQAFQFSFMMAYGNDLDDLKAKVTSWGNDFRGTFEAVQLEWEKRWRQIFTPGNDLVSGCVPVLETDDEKVKRVYYTGPLTMLYLMHTRLPVAKRVYLTGGPRWGATTAFFWDLAEWHNLWAMVDPQIVKHHLRRCLEIDISRHNAVDCYSGQGSGRGYVANYWCVFQLIRSYVLVNSDYAFLDEEIRGKTVLEHLEAMALNWKHLSKHGQEGYRGHLYKLADFGGDPWGLLECVPTYIHVVPSFNAGYVWMMNEMSALHAKLGNQPQAADFKREADAMAQRVLALYDKNGAWCSLHPDNKRVEVRHCLDFQFISKYMPQYLSDQMKAEMVDFVQRELLTDHWMRAQSLSDPAAEHSDRPDHGPMGAFDGWPAATMAGFCRLGYPQEAIDFYRRLEPVTHEGGWAQAHELWGPNQREKNAPVRIASRGWNNRDSSAGIAITDMLIRSLFGYRPNFDDKAGIRDQNVGSDFRGTLHHVRFGDAYFRVTYDGTKLKQERE